MAGACYDPNKDSCLYGCKPVAWVHDELITEIPDDEWIHERSYEIARIMRESMSSVLPDVRVGAQPAVMERWNKKAETVLNQEGRLQIWREPS